MRRYEGDGVSIEATLEDNQATYPTPQVIRRRQQRPVLLWRRLPHIIPARLDSPLPGPAPALVVVELKERGLEQPEEEPPEQEKEGRQEGKSLSHDVRDLEVGHGDVILRALVEG